jgi:ABC-2 type transport system permease protein
VFLFALAMPLILTVLVSAVFGGLFAPKPRLGIVDLGGSSLTGAARSLTEIDVRPFDDAETLRRRVEAHDLDAGLVLPKGFDQAVQTGERPDLEFLVAGESLASNRVVLAVITLDLVRGVAGREAPVEVAVTTVGDEDYVPVGDRLLPFLVFYAVVIAGLFVPSASLVEERERGTLDALLATPARMSEVLAAKGALGAGLAIAMGVVTLAINNAFAGRTVEMVVFLAVGAVMMAELGLVLGLLAKDMNTLYAGTKGIGFFVMLPALFALFPDLPQWIPRITPTFYFLNPVYDLAVRGASFGDVLPDLAVALALCAVLFPLVVALGARPRAGVAAAA